MNALKLTPIYLRWHYSTALLDMFRIDGNIFWFLWHFFSVPDTFRTFFNPWERMGEKYKKGFDVESFASILITNTIMRIVGILMRTILLFFALIFFIISSIVIVVAFLIWLFLPFIMLALAYYAIKTLII